MSKGKCPNQKLNIKSFDFLHVVLPASADKPFEF